MLPFYDTNAKLRYIKFCLLLFTFLFVLTGVGLIIIGSTINAIYVEYSQFLEIEYFPPAACLVLTGFVIFGVACIGLFGTLKRRPFVIGSFGVLLGAICILQIGAGVACYLMVGDLIDSLRSVMNETIFSYPQDEYARDLMDTVQRGLRCCGLDGITDWVTVYQTYNLSEIPRSCCVNDDGHLHSNFSNFNNRGCYGVLSNIIVDTSNVLTTSSFVLGLMQVTGMVFAIYMAKCVKQQIEAKKARKLFLTEQILYADEPDPKN